MCLAGASGAGAELLAAGTHPDLRAYYVWVPMLPPDDEAAAPARRPQRPRVVDAPVGRAGCAAPGRGGVPLRGRAAAGRTPLIVGRGPSLDRTPLGRGGGPRPHPLGP